MESGAGDGGLTYQMNVWIDRHRVTVEVALDDTADTFQAKIEAAFKREQPGMIVPVTAIAKYARDTVLLWRKIDNFMLAGA